MVLYGSYTIRIIPLYPAGSNSIVDYLDRYSNYLKTSKLLIVELLQAPEYPNCSNYSKTYRLVQNFKLPDEKLDD